MFRIDLNAKLCYTHHKGSDTMDKIKAVDLAASVCLLIGSIINIVELFINVHFIISIVATVLVLVSFFLWFVVLKRIKSKK